MFVYTDSKMSVVCIPRHVWIDFQRRCSDMRQNTRGFNNDNGYPTKYVTHIRIIKDLLVHSIIWLDKYKFQPASLVHLPHFWGARSVGIGSRNTSSLLF